MRIVIASPDLRHAELVRRRLLAAGYSSRHFNAGMPFLDFAASESVDLLLTDHRPGDLSVEDLILCARQLLPSLPIIVLLSVPRDSEVAASLQAGADDCIAKPAHGLEMLARVNALLRRVGG
jgi:two-component system OmpR family response regulator